MRNIEIHDAAMVRALAYDCGLSDPEQLLGILGFPPVSEDGALVEREASIRRVRRVLGATPLFAVQAAVISTLITMEHARLNGLDPEATDTFLPVAAAYEAVSLSSIVSSLAYLLDIGALTFNTKDEEDEDE